MKYIFVPVTITGLAVVGTTGGLYVGYLVVGVKDG